MDLAGEIRQLVWLVVRRPEASFDLQAPVPCRPKVVDGLLYHGLDRMAWWDLDALYWSGRLRGGPNELYQSVRSIRGPTDIAAARRLEDALALLRSSSEIEEKNEVVCAVGAGQPGERECEGVAWLGYDPVYKSGTPYTLLVEVFLERAGPLSSAVSSLNGFGLFRTAAEAQDFGDQYRALAQDEKVEPLPLLDHAFEVLAVGRLSAAVQRANRAPTR